MVLNHLAEDVTQRAFADLDRNAIHLFELSSFPRLPSHAQKHCRADPSHDVRPPRPEREAVTMT